MLLEGDAAVPTCLTTRNALVLPILITHRDAQFTAPEQLSRPTYFSKHDCVA